MSRGSRFVVLVSVFLLAMASVGAQAQVVLTVWDQFFPRAQSDLIDQYIAEFESLHPGVEVRRSVLDTDSIRTVLRTALTAGQGPDVFYYDAGPAFLGQLIGAGLVYDLTDVYQERGWTSRFNDWAVDRVTYSGRIYGVPNEVEYTGVFVNKAILEQIGMADRVIPDPENPEVLTFESFDAYLEILEAAKEAGYIPIAFANRDPGRGGHLVSAFIELTLGVERVEEILFGEGRWDVPEVVEALDLLRVLSEKGYFPRNVNALGYDEGNALFYLGQAATHITGTWLVSDILDQVPDPSVVDFVLFPPISEGIPMRAAAGLGSTWAIAEHSKVKDLAVEFLDYVMSRENARRWLEVASIIPPINGMTPEEYDLHPLMRRAVAGLSLPQGHGYNLDVVMPAEWNDAMKNGNQAIIAGQKTAHQVAAEMQEAWARAKARGDIWMGR